MFYLLLLLGESWLLINEMSSRKATKQGAIKASCKEERLEKWYNHFNQLIGRALVLEDNIQQMTYRQFLPHFSFIFKAINNIWFGWKICFHNKTSSSKASKPGAIRGSCNEETLEKWHYHFNNLLGRPQLLKDEYTDDALPMVYLWILFIFKAINNICFGWETCSQNKTSFSLLCIRSILTLISLNAIHQSRFQVSASIYKAAFINPRAIQNNVKEEYYNKNIIGS